MFFAPVEIEEAFWTVGIMNVKSFLMLLLSRMRFKGQRVQKG